MTQNNNQLLSEIQNLSTIRARTNSYAYDSEGRRWRHTFPSGNVVSNTFTARGQIAAIYADGTPALATFSYDALGNRATNTLENGTSVEYAYDNAQRMTTVTHRLNGTAFASFDYGYNAVGNRTNRTESSAGFQPATDAYTYDATDQIASVNYNAGTRTVSYQWDAVGNRTTVTDNGTGTNYTANALNQYTAIGGGSPTYDNRGNMATQNGWTYTYDAQNRLLMAEPTSPVDGNQKMTFAYDALNRCVHRQAYTRVTGNWSLITDYFLIYDNWNLIEEWATGGAQIAHYVHGPRIDELLVKVSTTNAVYYHHDALGNTTHLTGTNGVVVERYTYDVFGKPTILDSNSQLLSATAFGNRMLFTGREWLAEISLYDYRNRVYSPELGRFLQTDPIRFNAGDVNIYRYCGNDSVGFTDPLGLWSMWGHNLIDNNWNAQYQNGLTQQQIDLINLGSKQADAMKFQMTGYSFIHGMAYSGQTNAVQMTQQWIQMSITAAQDQAQAGNINAAFLLLGYAFHSIQDPYSPLHRTNGNPNTWHLYDFWRHLFGEGEQAVRDFQSQRRTEYQDMQRRMQDAYDEVFNTYGD